MFDEIFEIDEEFETIDKAAGQMYPFPVVTIINESMYFNIHASKIVPPRVKWIVTPNYIVGLPADENDETAYVMGLRKGSDCLRGGTFPHYMKNDKKIRTGHYRVYKYKNGFCMKRNEQLKEET